MTLGSSRKSDELKAGVPIVRVFKARARPGKEKELAEKLAKTSPTVVKGKPGFLGYYAGGPAQADSRDFLFVSTWQDFSALKEVFGDSWRESHLPPGYADLIEQHSIEHYELTDQALKSR
jgi:quinol monooxygenase YgiN